MLFDYIPVLINLFAISLCAVFFFIFMAQYIANREHIVYLFFSLIVAAAVVFNLSVMSVPLPAGGLVRVKMLLASYTAISVCISLAMQEIFSVRFRYSTAVLLGCLGVIAAGIAAAPDTRMLILYCGFISVITVLACQAYSCYIFIVSVTMDLRRYWLLFFLSPVVFSAFRNAYYLMNMRFDEVYLSIFLHVPVLMFVVTLFFFYDYEFQKRSGEGIYQTLLRKSQKLQRDLNKAKRTNAKPEPHEVVHDLVRYLDENYSESYNRRDLSKKFGLNENYMLQLFKRTTGGTISNYINARRIEEARRLLADRNNKIIDIAYHVGFENYSHFHRLFRRATGLTPRDYRDLTGE
jgi:AraC-like DNA-binding protein